MNDIMAMMMGENLGVGSENATTTILTADGVEEEVFVEIEKTSVRSTGSDQSPTTTTAIQLDDDYNTNTNNSSDDSTNSNSAILRPTSTTTTSSTPTSTIKKNVSFGALNELSFAVEKQKGDNKHEMAYPMTLGYLCVSQESWTVEDYEAVRPSESRGRGNELKLKMDERRLIIKASKKLAEEFNKAHNAAATSGRHKRRNSIGNGEINRWSQLTDFFSMGSSGSGSSPTNNTNSKRSSAPAKVDGENNNSNTATTTTAVVSASGRPQIKRQNSIGNGEISRLSRKSGSSNGSGSGNSGRKKFSKLLSFGRKESFGDSTSSTSSNTAAATTASTTHPRSPHRKSPRSTTTTTASTASSAAPAAPSSSTSIPPPGPQLRRVSSIGNGEIARMAAQAVAAEEEELEIDVDSPRQQSRNSSGSKPSFLKRFSRKTSNGNKNPKSLQRQNSD